MSLLRLQLMQGRGRSGKVGQVFDLTSVTIKTGDGSGLPEPFVASANLGQVKRPDLPRMSGPTKAVFLSYASQDAEAARLRPAATARQAKESNT